MTLGELYRRWRHTRGFGIHSPHAYQLIKRAVSPGYGYSWYGYSAIESSLEKNKEILPCRRDARLALRVVDFCRPSVVVADMAVNSHLKAGITAGGYPVRETVPEDGHIEREHPYLHLKEKECDPEDIRRIVDNGDYLLYFAREGKTVGKLTEELVTEMNRVGSGGIIMEGRKRLILIPRKESALYVYKIL